MNFSPDVRVIGVDFDNTIAGYDDLMHALAVERGLIDGAVPRNKKRIRDAIRALPGGEAHWRGLQVTAYGPKMREARPIAGVKEFLRECRRRGLPIYIVSHKTEFANFGDASVNLREAATAWLEREGFLGSGGLGFDTDSVFFESTREDKVARIAALGITHFIDDLEETFLESGFPDGVEKLLLGESEPLSSGGIATFRTWPEIQQHVFAAPDPVSLGRLLGGAVRSIARCGAGGNGRVHCVTLEDGTRYAAKAYLQPTMDGRDRLESEFGGLSFLWNHGERAIPRPIVASPELRLAVYEFVDGARIDSAHLAAGDIEQVAGFVARLKALAGEPAAAALPKAAEACDSFEALEANLVNRLARLQSLAVDGEAHASLHRYLSLEFVPAMEQALRRARAAVTAPAWSAGWPEAGQTLSPSDLGFHNALRRPDGSVVFLDFEYFGRDDAAKMLSDFLLHPAMRLTEAAKRAFAGAVLDLFRPDATLPDRFAVAYPLFALKWCLILLNEFVPSDLARRRFASAERIEREPRLTAQLEKSRNMLARAMREREAFPYGALRA